MRGGESQYFGRGKRKVRDKKAAFGRRVKICFMVTDNYFFSDTSAAQVSGLNYESFRSTILILGYPKAGKLKDKF